ncbi:MAG TPA: PAS domain S-box protein [Polyangia bacterium]|nr:PAS domain S-box protein [Polyangia bacterium]
MAASDETWFELSSQQGKPLIPERLRRSVADLVLETTAESIWLIDARARTTFVNRRMASLLGYTEEEMIGRPIFEFLDRSRWQAAEENLRKRQQGIEDRREVELIRKDGTRIWVIGSANPVFDRNGQYAGALALLGDLSPQKERERLLQRQVDHLRARVAEQPLRTAVVMGVLATFLAMVAVTTAGAVVGAALARSRRPSDEL